MSHGGGVGGSVFDQITPSILSFFPSALLVVLPTTHTALAAIEGASASAPTFQGKTQIRPLLFILKYFTNTRSRHRSECAVRLSRALVSCILL